MSIGIIMVVALAAFLTWTLSRSDASLATNARPISRSPIGEAERILAARYARGDISPNEYQRMLAILRR